MIDLLTADNTSTEMKELISNTICASIRFMKNMIVQQSIKEEPTILLKYWEFALASLPLVTLNVEIKTNRDN